MKFNVAVVDMPLLLVNSIQHFAPQDQTSRSRWLLIRNQTMMKNLNIATSLFPLTYSSSPNEHLIVENTRSCHRTIGSIQVCLHTEKNDFNWNLLATPGQKFCADFCTIPGHESCSWF